MSLTAAAIRLMAAKGMSADDIADIADAMEGAVAPPPSLSPGAIRTRQWRERLEATGMTAEEWRVTSLRIIARDKGVCQYCQTTKGRMACDHITPLAQGGTSTDDNLVCACHACNGGKSGNTLERWLGEAKAAQWRYHRETSRDISHVGERAQVVTPSLPSLRSEEVKTPTEPNGSVAPKGAKRGSKRVPDSWSPSEPTLLILGSEGHTAGDLERALTRMRDHEFKAPRTDWDASFRNWVRTDAERKPKPHERHHPDAKYDARQANLARHERGADLAARLHRDAY